MNLMKTSSSSGKTVGYLLEDENGNKVSASQKVKQEYVEVSYEFIAKTTGSMKLQFYLMSNSGNYNLYVKDILIVEQ